MADNKTWARLAKPRAPTLFAGRPRAPVLTRSAPYSYLQLLRLQEGTFLFDQLVKASKLFELSKTFLLSIAILSHCCYTAESPLYPLPALEPLARLPGSQ